MQLRTKMRSGSWKCILAAEAGGKNMKLERKGCRSPSPPPMGPWRSGGERRIHLALAVALLVAVAGCAHKPVAPPVDEAVKAYQVARDGCLTPQGEGAIARDRVIEACTKVIQSGRAPKGDLLAALKLRAKSY